MTWWTNPKFRLGLQLAIFALCIATIALVSRGTVILDDRKDFVEATLPNGHLHAVQLFDSGLALAIISGLILTYSVLNMIIISNQKTSKSILNRIRMSKIYIGSMVLSSILMIPINLAVTVIAASQSAKITSALPDRLIRQVAKVSGLSLEYKDTDVVLDFTILGWILWLTFLMGTIIEYRAWRDNHIGEEKSESNSP